MRLRARPAVDGSGLTGEGREMRPSVHASILDNDGARFFGPGPQRLLEGVARLGSLSAVSREMSMSYSKANRIIKNAESVLGFPLLTRRIGGADGGSSELTPQGLDFLTRYQDFEAVCEQAAEAAFSTCFEGLLEVPRCACVVLANGRATRFGSQKLLAQLDGKPVLEHTLAALPGGLLDTVVAAAPGPVAELAEAAGYRCVAPAGPDISDSVKAGLGAIGDAAGCLFVCGDQPQLSQADVEALVAAHRTHPTAVVRLAARGRAANPVLWPRDLLSALEGLQGDRGGASLIESRPDIASRVILVEAASPASVADVDTPEQLRRLDTRS